MLFGVKGWLSLMCISVSCDVSALKPRFCPKTAFTLGGCPDSNHNEGFFISWRVGVSAHVCVPCMAKGAVHQRSNEGEPMRVCEEGGVGVGGRLFLPTQIWDEVCSHNQATLLQLIQSYWHTLTQLPAPAPSHIVHLLLLLIFPCFLKHWDLFGDWSHMILNRLFSPLPAYNRNTDMFPGSGCTCVSMHAARERDKSILNPGMNCRNRT